jgi:tetratricopeptide (TPR) repeat protein
MRKKYLNVYALLFIMIISCSLIGCNDKTKDEQNINYSTSEVDKDDKAKVSNNTSVKENNEQLTTIEDKIDTKLSTTTEDKVNNQQSTKIEDKVIDDDKTSSVLSVLKDENELSENGSSIENAKKLNKEGFKLYNEGLYEEALELFKQSIEEYDSFHYSHYNYACTLGVLMKENYPEWYYYKDEVIKHLKKVLELNPSSIEKIKTDSDLELIRKEFNYLKLLGYSPYVDKDIYVYLSELDWYIQGQGIIQVVGGATFDKNNRFTIYYLDTRGFDEGNFDFPINEFTGAYSVENGKVKFVLDDYMLRRRSYSDFFNFDEYDSIIEFEGTFEDGGFIRINIFNYPITSWYDEFSA